MEDRALLEPNNSASNWSTLSSLQPLSSTFNTEVHAHVMMSLFLLFNVFGIGGNLLILYVVPKIPSDEMEDSTKVCYMGQAATDAIASTLYFIGPFTETLGEWTGWRYGRMTFCKVIGLMSCSFPGISILHIAFLNADRYLFITRPMLYSRIATRKRAKCASITMSLFNLSLLSTFVCIHDASGEILRYHRELRMCLVDFQEPTFMPFSLCMFIMPWAIGVCLVVQYCHIVKISKNHLNRIKPSAGRGQNPKARNSSRNCMSYQSDPLSVPTDRRANLNPRGATKALNRQDLLTIKNQCLAMFPSSANAESLDAAKAPDGQERPHTTGKNHAAKNPSPRICRSAHAQMPSVETEDVDHSQERSSARRPPKFSTLRQNLRILRTPIIVTSCFFFTFLPITFMSFYKALTGGDAVNNFSQAFLTAMVSFSGGVNIIIYYYTIKPFKQILKNTLKRR